jgi:hypothetical protein
VTVNPDQAIFDAIAAATRLDYCAVVIDTKKFIETFNGHRDRKLCTSLDSYEVMHLKAMLANEHQKTVPVEDRNRIAQEIAQDCDAEMARLSGIIIDQTHEIERLRGISIAKTTRPHLITREAAAARIEALEKALRRIDAINDNPAIFNKDFDDVCRAALAPSYSPPVFHAPHNSGERLPSGDAAAAGGEAIADKLAAAFARTLSTQEGGQEHLNAEETLRRILWDNAAVIIAGLRSVVQTSSGADGVAAYERGFRDGVFVGSQEKPSE